jgi:hypothetical protein
MRSKIGIFTLALVAFCGSQSVFADQLVTNGGFETGDFTGWTVAGPATTTSSPSLYFGVDTVDADSGTYGAYLGSQFGVLQLSQTLTLADNHDYTVSFSLANLGAALLPNFINSFTVSIGGTTIFTETNAPASAYTNYSFSFDTTATSPTSEVLLISSENDASYFSLDNVSVSTTAASATTPEPATFLLIVPAVGLLALRRRKAVSKN